MRYAFLDESGDVSLTTSRFLVVAVLVTDQPRWIESLVKRAYQKLGRKSKSGEIKASASEASVIKWLLDAIALRGVDIIAVVVDKARITRLTVDAEDVYRQAATRAIKHCVERWPRMTCSLDKRYTKQALRYRLEEAIREGLVDVPQEVVLIWQEDSRTRKALQAVDCVAWAFFQKYEKGQDEFYRAIKERIVVEELIESALW
jgi:hypothetical protein